MMTKPYYTDEAILPLPPGFEDRSTNILEWKTPEGDKIALVINRQELLTQVPAGEPVTEDFDALVVQQTKGYATAFAGLLMEREDEGPAEVAFPVRRKAFRFRHETDVLYQCQAYVLLGRRVVVLTAASKAAHREAVDSLVENMLTGLKAWEQAQ